MPTLTNRANYIHWLHDLLLLSSPEGEARTGLGIFLKLMCDPHLFAVPPCAGSAQVRGLDIGCGASFIYCLLGAGIYGWQMVGCDITSVALK